MRVSTYFGLSLFWLQAFAFLSGLLENDLSKDDLIRLSGLAAKISADVKTKRLAGIDAIKPGFDAGSQLVENTGEHAFVCR